jgi:hypothetical protein
MSVWEIHYIRIYITQALSYWPETKHYIHCIIYQHYKLYIQALDFFTIFVTLACVRSRSPAFALIGKRQRLSYNMNEDSAAKCN